MQQVFPLPVAKKRGKTCATFYTHNTIFTRQMPHLHLLPSAHPPRVDLGQGNFRHWVFIFSPSTTTTLFCNHSISNSCWKRHETCVLKVVCRLTVWQAVFDWMSFLRFCDLQTWITSQFHNFYIFLLVPQWKCIDVYVKYIYICQLLLDIIHISWQMSACGYIRLYVSTYALQIYLYICKSPCVLCLISWHWTSTLELCVLSIPWILSTVKRVFRLVRNKHWWCIKLGANR